MEFTTAAHKAMAKHAALTTGSPEDFERVNVGVMGTANIARKNCLGIKQVRGVKVVAVASRDSVKAASFAKEFGIERSYGSYCELLEDEEIDAVYVPLPTSLHAEWVVKAANAGKHVLCEKPCALTSKELSAILEACSKNDVFFMDAVMFMHHVRLSLICQDLDSGKFGEHGPTHLSSMFSFPGDETFFKSNIRTRPDLDALGCVGDLGWYSIRLALFAFGWELPDSASGVIHVERDGVPMDFTGTLTWRSARSESEVEASANKAQSTLGGLPLVRTSTFHCSFLHANQQWAVFSGEKGTLMLDDFVIPRSTEQAFWVDETRVHYEMTESGTRTASQKKTFKSGECRQESQMWGNFRNCVNACKNGASLHFWPGLSLATQLCVDAALASARAGGAEQQVDPDGLMEAFAAHSAAP